MHSYYYLPELDFTGAICELPQPQQPLSIINKHYQKEYYYELPYNILIDNC